MSTSQETIFKSKSKSESESESESEYSTVSDSEVHTES